MEAEVLGHPDDPHDGRHDDVAGTGTPGGRVRRPMNAFLIFCKRHRALVREKNSHLDNRSVTRILGERWAALDATDKAMYTSLAKQYKDAFMKANPDYKWYNPERSASNASTLSQKVAARGGHLAPGSITPGKLADPNNMGGLSLLLMAGTSIDGQGNNQPENHADNRDGRTSNQAASHPDRQTGNKADSHPDGQTANKTEKGSSLLQLAEMCSFRLDDPDPGSRAPSSITMTPPWTPKHDMFDDWTNQKADNKPQTTTNQKPEHIASYNNNEKCSNAVEPMAFTCIKPNAAEPVAFTCIKPQPVTIDNFIETMFCHEIVSSDAPIKSDTTTTSGGSMTFGQIQETLIRRAMESTYAKSDSVVMTPSIKVSENRDCDSEPSVKSPNRFLFLTPVKNEGDKPSGNNGEEMKKLDADLTCHEIMEDISPVTREEIAHKLLSSTSPLSTSLLTSRSIVPPLTSTPANTHTALPTATSLPLLIPNSLPSLSSLPMSRPVSLCTASLSPQIAHTATANNLQTSPKYNTSPTAASNPQTSPKYSSSPTAAATSPQCSKSGEENNVTQPHSESEEEEEEAGGIRKSRRRNRGQRYQQLMSAGLITRHRRTDSHSEETVDKDFAPPSQPPVSATRRRKRTVSETSAADDKKYCTGDFDLEERIANLPPCAIDGPAVKRARRPVRQRHLSMSSLPPPATSTKSEDLNIAELCALKGTTGTTATAVTGSARRKARRHAITRLLSVETLSVISTSNNAMENSMHSKENSAGSGSEKENCIQCINSSKMNAVTVSDCHSTHTSDCHSKLDVNSNPASDDKRFPDSMITNASS